MIRAILTDIEGTTTSLSFVKDVLFPYARQRMAAFITEQATDPAIARELAEVAHVVGHPLDTEGTIAQLLAWMDEDRKATPLKNLQGRIWEAGYRNSDFFGHVYEDAERHLRQWKAEGLELYVFSSGSIQAQKLLFGHTEYGDLTPLFSGYFDTNTGPKQEAGSYREITGRIGLEAPSILFLSDIEAELDAAREAGLATTQLIRESAVKASQSHPTATRFDEITV